MSNRKISFAGGDIFENSGAQQYESGDSATRSYSYSQHYRRASLQQFGSPETTVLMRNEDIEYGPTLIEQTSMSNLSKQ